MLQEAVVPAAQFDWTSSGLVNPLDCKYFLCFQLVSCFCCGSDGHIPIFDIGTPSFNCMELYLHAPYTLLRHDINLNPFVGLTKMHIQHIIVCSMYSLHEMDSYRAGNICLPACMHESS
jgi:hypothetical protein